jgi:hypothetical protein
MFRMSPGAFACLCDLISSEIGEDEFRSERTHPTREDVTVPGIPGEVKVAVAI